jgi:hypothetical protein
MHQTNAFVEPWWQGFLQDTFEVRCVVHGDLDLIRIVTQKSR